MNHRFARLVPAFIFALALTPAMWAAGTATTQGTQIKGQVKEKCGQSLPDNLQAQLVDGQGVAVPGMTTAVASDGTFVFNNVPAGMYTVQIIRPQGAVAEGSSVVVASAGRLIDAIVTIGTAKCGFFKSKTTLAVLAAAAAGGTIAIIATQDEASGSR